MVEDWQAGGFGLYVHWPFCESLCPYCDFNSYVARSIDHQAWHDAYAADLTRISGKLGRRTLRSVYFGGGTPSLMQPATVEIVLNTAREQWTFSNDVEITLEANPGSVETRKLQDFRAAGINRVSLGVQALDDDDLRRLGRLHTADEAKRAVDIAQSVFDRVSFDLICARQHQPLKAWEAELTEGLSWGTDHLAIYQLTIEAGTAFGDRLAAGSLTGLPDEDLGAEIYLATQQICETHGLPGYEISNHARPGNESRHNLIYWQGGDYAGIGPGAHGRLTIDGNRYATETHLNPAQWLDAVKNGNGTRSTHRMTQQERAEEYLMMSLRTTIGTDLDRFERILACPLKNDRIKHLGDLGLIEAKGPTLRATLSGKLVLNAVIADLLAD